MPLGEAVSSSLLVKVKGAALPVDVAPMLVNGYVDDSSNVPDLFVLRFTDEAGTVLAKAGFEIGAEVELSVQTSTPGGPQRLLVGEVTALEVELTEQGVHTVVRGLDKSHRLFRGTRVEAYLNMKASDIVQKVAKRVGAGCERRADRAAAPSTWLRTASATGTSCAGSLPRTAGFSAWSTGSCTSYAAPRPVRRPVGGSPERTRSSCNAA